MIKNILFDFDGVILDSMKIKGDGFKELFREFPEEKTDKFLKFHYEHGGVPRFDKIRYFYQDILGKEISNDEVLSLADKFAEIISKRLFDKQNIIQETLEFIKNNHKKYNFHIVSGAEHNELNQLCKVFDIDKYFITINGSPVLKHILVENILEKYRYSKDETILIGDSLTDLEAAVKNDIEFYGYNNRDLVKYNYIENFTKVVL